MGAADRRRATGFTIIELMIVVSIIGILAAFAIPAFSELIQNNRRTVVVNELMSTLMLARSEAAKRGQIVVTCGINDADGDKIIDDGEEKCSGTGAEDWSDGWLTFVDLDEDGVLDSAEKPPMRQFINDYPDVKVTVVNMMTTAPPASGSKLVAMKPFNRSSSNGTVRICDKRGASKARAIIVAQSGRAQTSDKTATGTALTCP